jgi:hypothetical protein
VTALNEWISGLLLALAYVGFLKEGLHEIGLLLSAGLLLILQDLLS